MLSPQDFREIVSGQRRGFVAACWRALLAAVEPFYTAAVRLRNWQFDTGRRPIAKVNVPVVSVGNVTLGGTGKTPFIAWLADWFTGRGVQVAIVSRGYGAKPGEPNDEARELAEKLPQVPHLQNSRRAVAAEQAIEQHGAQLILLDDGMQHRYLHRDLEIVLLDALEPFGHNHVFPRGTLREPLAGLARADAIALSRRDTIDEPTARAIEQRVRQYNSRAVWIELRQVPRGLRGRGGQSAPLTHLQNQTVLAFCGIGNPAGFRRTLNDCGLSTIDCVEYADHHNFTTADWQSLQLQAQQAGATALVCTHKDLVKLPSTKVADVPVWALEIGTEITTGQPQLEALLTRFPLK
jgi:tetraacyldisaccharide 4'-kinase